MSFINSVTSGMNINFGNGFFNNDFNNFNNFNNINIENDYENNNEDEDEDEEIENNEEDEDGAELFMKKREQFILELDEFQFKHLKKYSALKEDKCAICLLKYKGADIIKEFTCKHIFHKNCIFKWLKTSNVCPICKHDFTEEINKVELRDDDEDNE